MSREHGRRTTDADALRAHIRALEERLLDPALRGDREALGELLADGFREHGSSGRHFDRTAILEALAAESRGDDARRAAIADFSLRVLAPDVALATYRAETRGGSADAPRASLRSSVWVRREGRWRILFHQGTPAAPGGWHGR